MTKNNTKPIPPTAITASTVGVVISRGTATDEHHNVKLSPTEGFTQILHVFAGISLEITPSTQVILQRLNPLEDTELLNGDVLIVNHDNAGQLPKV